MAAISLSVVWVESTVRSRTAPLLSWISSSARFSTLKVAMASWSLDWRLVTSRCSRTSFSDGVEVTSSLGVLKE